MLYKPLLRLWNKQTRAIRIVDAKYSYLPSYAECADGQLGRQTFGQMEDEYRQIPISKYAPTHRVDNDNFPSNRVAIQVADDYYVSGGKDELYEF